MKKRLFVLISMSLQAIIIIGCGTTPLSQSAKSSSASIQEWIEVGDYDVLVHGIVLGQEVVNGRRLASIEVEYANNRSAEELSCRRNQWYLYDSQGYSYEAESDWFNEQFNGDLYEITNLHYLGGDNYLSQNANLRGWLIFVVPQEATIEKIQFMTDFLDTKTTDILVSGTK